MGALGILSALGALIKKAPCLQKALFICGGGGVRHSLALARLSGHFFLVSIILPIQGSCIFGSEPRVPWTTPESINLPVVPTLCASSLPGALCTRKGDTMRRVVTAIAVLCNGCAATLIAKLCNGDLSLQKAPALLLAIHLQASQSRLATDLRCLSRFYSYSCEQNHTCPQMLPATCRTQVAALSHEFRIFV